MLALKPAKDAMPAKTQDKSGISGILKLWLPVAACMGFIFYASSIPGKNIPALFVNQDIVFHTSIYLLLAYFFSRALKNTYQDITVVKLILFTVIFGVIYGITDELHQVFVPYRTVSAWDVFNDGIGSLIGSLLYR